MRNDDFEILRNDDWYQWKIRPTLCIKKICWLLAKAPSGFLGILTVSGKDRNEPCHYYGLELSGTILWNDLHLNAKSHPFSGRMQIPPLPRMRSLYRIDALASRPTVSFFVKLCRISSVSISYFPFLRFLTQRRRLLPSAIKINRSVNGKIIVSANCPSRGLQFTYFCLSCV